MVGFDLLKSAKIDFTQIRVAGKLLNFHTVNYEQGQMLSYFAFTSTSNIWVFKMELRTHNLIFSFEKML